MKKNIKLLITTIEVSECVSFDSDSREGAAFERLKQIASDSLWVELSKSHSAVMRVYAFDALRLNNDPQLTEVKNRLKNDTSTICWRSADMRMVCSVSFYVSK